MTFSRTLTRRPAMTSPTRLLSLGAALALALSLTACDSFAPEPPSASAETHGAASAAPAHASAKGGPSKVALCHRTGSDTNRYVPISVAAPAVDAHLGHGDAAVGDPVPGTVGFVFDEACEPIDELTTDERRCVADAEALGLDVIGLNVVAGTEGKDYFDHWTLTNGPDLICGFGELDTVTSNLEEGDVFLGGEGNDSISGENRGIFYGGAGVDDVDTNAASGIFYGGPDSDYVIDGNFGFYDGGDGDDVLGGPNEGTTVNVEFFYN